MALANKNINKFWAQWSLKTHHGRQWWEFKLPEQLKGIVNNPNDWEKPEAEKYLNEMADAFVFDRNINPNSADKVFREQIISQYLSKGKPDAEKATTDNLKDAAKYAAQKGFSFYETLQTEAGNWPGDYGGPMFLMPGLIFVAHLTDTPFDPPVKTLMIQYFFNLQNEDGGWGLHIEGESTMFGTVLQYVSLRLLGVDKEKPEIAKAKNWILENGGATGLPPWGKFYMSILGLYAWEGNDSLLPELWILPKWVPFHPGKYWPHSRMVLLPMTYAFGERITAETTPLIKSLREEIYPIDYASINWKKSRKACAPMDQYQPVSPLYNVFSSLANFYEKIHLRSVRKKALKFISNYIDAEDKQTNFINIGPVNQVINSLCVWHKHGKESSQFRNHVNRWKDYLWVAEDGIKMNGYNGSQLWDTIFATQALLDSGLENEFVKLTRKMYAFIDDSQIRTNHFEYNKYFRDKTIGAWPFSTRDHGWTITDCTAEGVKSVIMLNGSEPVKSDSTPLLELDRLSDSIDILLYLQNPTGGWASYERTRGPAWLEKLNPSQIFGNIMIEYDYVECSSAVLQGLKKFAIAYPGHRNSEINNAIAKGLEFIKSVQREDGSWYGSWGVCFTYGTWFGIEGLLAAGESAYDGEQVSPNVKKACEFLAGKQREDGSWGESFESCVLKKYIEHEEGQVINTAWALLGLMAAQYPDKNAIERGIKYLIKLQENSGDWAQEGISGVFNGNCMEVYTSYRNVFPLWALGRYARLYREAVED